MTSLPPFDFFSLLLESFLLSEDFDSFFPDNHSFATFFASESTKSTMLEASLPEL